MSRRTPSDSLGAYTSAGGLLPAATLRRVVDEPGSMPDGTPDGYGLPPKSKLDEHIDRAWHDARAYWNDFTARAADVGLLDTNADPTAADRPGDPTLAKLTVAKLVLPLLDLLGWHDVDRRRNGIEGDADRRDSDGNRTRWPVTHEAAKRHVPVHIVGYDVPLDARTRGVYGAERQSPHSTVQDLLNGSEKHLWGIAVNGRHLRLLRDSSSLTRQAYAEFDLHAILHDGAYAEFAALWLLLHASRFTVPDADDATVADIPVERLQREATNDGIRALDHLRDGVKDAIEELGTGLIAHPRNQTLRDALASGEVTDGDFYNQVLRTVYRLVFLFAVEDRNLLHPTDADSTAVAVYAEHYSTLRLREQARKHRGGRHGDGWQHYQQLVTYLRDGQPALAIPPVTGWLWSEQAAPHVDGCRLDNRSLYAALRHLSTIEQDRALHRVSYKHLGAEELGSVYESLLELTPRLDGRRFRLDDVAGNERKTTGSYYTPTSLIARVLDDALDPVIDRALQQARARPPETATPEQRQQALERAILGLTVCDPAMGSAHFLVAAAHRLAKRLAEIRTGDPEPDPLAVQAALRDTVSHCIYGIDVNPMAVELARVALWLECHVPGTPLTFLDHHLKCGNALLGVGLDPSLMDWTTTGDGTGKWGDGGVPDDAFKALHGDDKAAAKQLRDANRKRRAGQASLLASGDRHDDPTSELADRASGIAWMDDTTPKGLAAKEQAWMVYGQNEQLVRERLKADAWTACWTIPKTKEQASADDQPFDVFYDAHFNGLPADPRPGVIQARQQADEHRFFHWHVEFPEITAAGGFACLLGNPPWERMKIQQKEWFASHSRNDIADVKNAASRRKAIKELTESPETADQQLAAEWEAAQQAAAAQSNFVRQGGRFPHGGVGDVNLYALFADHFLAAHHDDGAAGLICPVGLATGATYADFFGHLVDTRRLRSFWSFWNHDRLFPAVNDRVTFALVTLVGPNLATDQMGFTGYVWQPHEIDDPMRRYTLTRDEISAINPNTKNAPLFRRSADAEVISRMHRLTGVLVNEESSDAASGGVWGVRFISSLFHMGNDAELFLDESWAEATGAEYVQNKWRAHGATAVPLYEGKLIWNFDHRAGTYEGQTPQQKAVSWIPETSEDQHRDPSYSPKPAYWVDAQEVLSRLPESWDRTWYLGWRQIARSTDERTLVASVLPRTAVGNSIPLMLPSTSTRNVPLLLAAMSSFAVDFRARNAVENNLSQFIVKQLPLALHAEVPLPDGTPIARFVAPRVAELTYTAWDLEGWAADIGFAGVPFLWSPSRRAVLRAELDASMFFVFGFTRDEVDWVLETFDSLAGKERRPPERGGFGEFRTKRLILERYDEMARATPAAPYSCPLEAPPADDSVRHR